MSSELIVERRTALPVSPAEAFAWHARPGALERLTPPWWKLRVLDRTGLVENGARVTFLVRAGPLELRWTAEHRDVEPGRGFTDLQVSGPFDRWVHTHRMDAGDDGRAVLHDRILCEPPFGMRLGRARLRRELERTLAWRHAVTAADLAMHAAAAGLPPLHIAVTGASGLIGSTLIPALTTGGHRVTRLVRGVPREGEIHWDPAGGGLDPAALRGVDAVVHLAGENIAGAHWNDRHKRRVLESRRTGTRLLAEAVARAPGGPGVLVSASAIGIYGDRGDEVLTEESAPGRGFLPEVARAWEDGTRPAEEAGVRVVRLRIGLVLTPAGGLLERLLPPFRLGLGGRIGSGAQWMSWISVDDLVGAFHHAITAASARGPMNAVGPEPVTNAVFTRALGAALHRPTFFPVPAGALRLVFGQMADEAILASARVLPAALVASGYRFRHPALPAALAHVLGVTP
jgi:uncharacterized protein